MNDYHGIMVAIDVFTVIETGDRIYFYGLWCITYHYQIGNKALEIHIDIIVYLCRVPCHHMHSVALVC